MQELVDVDFRSDKGRFVVDADDLISIPIEQLKLFEKIMQNRLAETPNMVLEVEFDRDYRRYIFNWYTKKDNT